MFVSDVHRTLKAKPDIAVRLTGSLSVSKNVSVTWSWYNENQGLVQWTFTNSGSEVESVILIRGAVGSPAYVFGDAFGPVYLANSPPLCPTCTGQNSFGTSWIYAEPQSNGGVSLVNGAIPVLVDNGVENNSMPMAPVQFPNGSWCPFAFIFTLAPGQKWSVLEGGFSSVLQPTIQGVYTVSLGYVGNICIKYDPARVSDWDAQTGTSLNGYSPNPSTFNIATVMAGSDVPFDVLPYSDSVVRGVCVSSQPQPQPSPVPTQCIEEILTAINEYQTNPFQALLDFVNGLTCFLNYLNSTSSADIAVFESYLVAKLFLGADIRGKFK
ncbi:MAG: hypothetical protein QXO47_10040 [Thermoproteota archaeon]